MKTFKSPKSLEAVVICETADNLYNLYMELYNEETCQSTLRVIRLDGETVPRTYGTLEEAYAAADAINALAGGFDDKEYAIGYVD